MQKALRLSYALGILRGMTFGSILARWPTLVAFATDVGIPYQTAAGWKRRNSIPADRWDEVLAAARKAGVVLTVEHLYEAVRNSKATEAA